LAQGWKKIKGDRVERHGEKGLPEKLDAREIEKVRSMGYEFVSSVESLAETAAGDASGT
jgi:hypothetical protein